MAGSQTFKGGVFPPPHKNTARMAVREVKAPAALCLSLELQKGVFCTPLVQVGDTVRMGQVIARRDSDGFPVHCGVSGFVSELIRNRDDHSGSIVAIRVENDFEYRLDPSCRPYDRSLYDATAEELLDVIREAGIVGLGGGCFPTYEKLKSAIGRVEHLVINGIESEPYITANQRLLLENPGSVLGGAKIVLKILGLRTAIFALDERCREVGAELLRLKQDKDLMQIRYFKSKYPQGDERRLVSALSGKELSVDHTPADLGMVILNAETCAAIYHRFVSGIPLIRRIVTVDGDCISRPGNYFIPIGMSVRDLVQSCKGLCRVPDRVIVGGPMMGNAITDWDTPLQKGSIGLLLLSRRFLPRVKTVSNCIRCGRCVSACPMHLMPLRIYELTEKKEIAPELWKKEWVQDCMECGSCSYDCPSGLDLVGRIRQAKVCLLSRSLSDPCNPEENRATGEFRETDAPATENLTKKDRAQELQEESDNEEKNG